MRTATWGLALAAAAVALATSAPGAAQTIVVELGPEETVYDWQTDRCAIEDIPDTEARAFVDATGQVQLLALHYGPVGYRMVGENLRDVRRDCAAGVNVSHRDPAPRQYDDVEWLWAPYTFDGSVIYALVHDEYHGWEHSNCNSTAVFDCWWNSITLAVSADGGRSYQHAPAPAHVVADSAYDYDPNNLSGPYGFFGPSNVVTGGDGYYYAFVKTWAHGTQAWGSCLMRTPTLDDPASWRFFDGVDFTVPPDRAVCTPVAQIGHMPESVTYNSYFGRYLMAGARGEPTDVHFALSDTLANWPDPRQVLMATDLFWTPGATVYRAYFALLQPGDPTRNFERTGRSPFLYYTYWDSALGTYDRDLRRRRVRFSLPADVGRYDVLDLEMNEHVGVTTLDSSYYGNDATLVGAAGFTSECASGSSAIALSAPTGVVRSGSGAGSSSLDVTGSISIEAFVRVVQPSGSFVAVARKEIDTTQRNYALYIVPLGQPDAGKLHFSYSSAGTPVVDGVGAGRIDDGRWHHVAVTFNDADRTARYYVDGLPDAARVHTLPLGDLNAAAVEVGYGLDGIVDSVRVYDYVRSDAEIAADAIGSGSIELCNGADDDGDGVADDGFGCVRGAVETAMCASTGAARTRTCRADCSPGTWTEPCCGDGVVEATEQCDDGNAIDTDGCTNACALRAEVPPGPSGCACGVRPSPQMPIAGWALLAAIAAALGSRRRS